MKKFDLIFEEETEDFLDCYSVIDELMIDAVIEISWDNESGERIIRIAPCKDDDVG
jgi:hypothetical protein